MENFDIAASRVAKDESANVISNPLDSHSPMRRELDSMDDFEHLDHDGSPQHQTGDDEGRLLDFLKSDVPQKPPNTQNFGLLDDLTALQGDAHDKFTGETNKDSHFAGFETSLGGAHKSAKIDQTQSFLDFEREPLAPSSNIPDVKHDTKPQEYHGFDEAPPAMKFEDDDDEDDFRDFKDFTKKKDDFVEHSKPVLDEFKDFTQSTGFSFGHAGFGDTIPKDEPLLEEPKPIFEESKPIEPEPIKVAPKPVREPTPEPVREPTPEPIREPTPEPVREPTPEPVREPTPEPPKKQELPAKVEIKAEAPPKTEEKVTKPVPERKPQQKHEVIAAEAMFCQMGLDAWFNPERLNPKVESLIYWRCPRKSGVVFGVSLALLLALSCFSLISVLAYASLAAVCGCMAFRIYRNVLQAVQKTSDGHPFKELLESDVSVSQEKAQQVATVAVTHVNAAVTELRRLFLVEDLVDSTKFIVLLWCLTYLGAWFNGMTLIIIGFVALFTLPKVYETNKTQIDANLDVVRSKLQEITSKVKAAVPIGKKTESEKDK